MTTLIGGTDTGLVRETNQDRYEFKVLSDRIAFAVLCDGMGGHSGGNVASEIATKFAADMLARDLRDGLSELSLRNLLNSACAGANGMVYEAAQKNPDLASMGTTIVIAVFYGSQLVISYVGDSRAYVASPSRVAQLTKDHTVVQMLVDIGEISKADAQSHPKRHYITRAVGVSPSLDADFLVHDMADDDIVLLCSDGLYNYFEEGQLFDLLSKCVAENSVDALIQVAKDGGGSDNITAVVGVNQPVGGNASHG